jgi:hypothetical protein
MAGTSTTRSAIALAVFAAAYVYFGYTFQLNPWRPSVDLAWLVAIAAWAAAFWRADTPSAARLHHPYWFYALYVAAMALFATNWRWVMAGDNLSWPFYGIIVHDHGLNQTALSATGPDNFAVLPALLQNTFMIIFEPTVFWHRLGKIFIALGALAAIYTVFARLVQPAFGLLVAACSATCSVWIVYSYSSGMFINGLASTFTILAIGLWVRRDLDSARAWLAFGLFSGFMLYLPPTGWVLAGFLWAWLGILVLLRGKDLRNPVVAALGGLIVGAPIIWQWWSGQGLTFTLVQNPDWSMDKVLRFLRQAVYFPFYSLLEDSGAFGAQLPWGFRWLFIPGLIIAPLFPKRFPGARLVFVLWALHVISLAFAQGPYAAVSVKRALVLIPFATYFVFILFHSYLRHLPVALLLIGAWASLGVYDIAFKIKPGRTGYTLLDGAVEAHQRLAPATVCVYLPNDGRAEALKPGSDLDRLYGLSDRMKLVPDVNDPLCTEALCYCSQEQCERVDLQALGYEPFPLQNSVEFACGRRPSPGKPPAP